MDERGRGADGVCGAARAVGTRVAAVPAMLRAVEYDETVKWLEARGGSWMVRATAREVSVVASVGSARAVRIAPALSRNIVEEALVEAVDELRREARMPADAVCALVP